ncbi:hypothetical protein [Cylindrospermopsis raciborskii]|nr:hypothetical protein [Cylindrospermopsis raciborskii]
MQRVYEVLATGDREALAMRDRPFYHSPKNPWGEECFFCGSV